jgi:hypothetical protein
MASRLTSAIQILFFVLASACCIPFSEVLIEESNPAWEAAFRAPVPKSVVVTHGRYWKGIHWSAEYSWFFALEPSEDFLNRFIEQNRMEEMVAANTKEDLVFEMVFTPPEWFAPPGPSYQIWRSDEVFLFLDKAQGTIFVHGGML